MRGVVGGLGSAFSASSTVAAIPPAMLPVLPRSGYVCVRVRVCVRVCVYVCDVEESG